MDISGAVIRVFGVVVDMEFRAGDLPGIHNALAVQSGEQGELILEVQEHINSTTVRSIYFPFSTYIF